MTRSVSIELDSKGASLSCSPGTDVFNALDAPSAHVTIHELGSSKNRTVRSLVARAFGSKVQQRVLDGCQLSDLAVEIIYVAECQALHLSARPDAIAVDAMFGIGLYLGSITYPAHVLWSIG